MNPHFPLCRPLHLLVFTLCISLSISFAAAAQTDMPAPLPPPAQEALDKGIIAAKVPNYLLAIRYFEDARKIAPDAPVIYMNLGVAESKIPSRELRAIAWLAAYLAAVPNAPNAAAVKQQITVLDVRNQSNVSHLLQAVQDAARQVRDNEQRRLHLLRVPILWARAKDFSSALIAAELLEETYDQAQMLEGVADIQVTAGDIAGSQETVAKTLARIDLLKGNTSKAELFTRVAQVQTRAGDLSGAQKSLASARKVADLSDGWEGLLTPALLASVKWRVLADIIQAQAKNGDIAGALETAALADKTLALTDAEVQKSSQRSKGARRLDIAKAQIKAADFQGALRSLEQVPDDKGLKGIGGPDPIYSDIAEGQAKAGDFAGAKKTADLISDVYFKNQAHATITHIQAQAGSGGTPSPDRQSMSDPIPSAPPSIPVSAWITLLDEDADPEYWRTALNTRPFLDLAGYLKSRPPFDHPQKAFDDLYKTAEVIVDAQNMVHQMLKQQSIQ